MAENPRHRHVDLEHRFDRLVEQKLSQAYTLLVPSIPYREDGQAACAIVLEREKSRDEK